MPGLPPPRGPLVRSSQLQKCRPIGDFGQSSVHAMATRPGRQPIKAPQLRGVGTEFVEVTHSAITRLRRPCGHRVPRIVNLWGRRDCPKASVCAAKRIFPENPRWSNRACKRRVLSPPPAPSTGPRMMALLARVRRLIRLRQGFAKAMARRPSPGYSLDAGGLRLFLEISSGVCSAASRFLASSMPSVWASKPWHRFFPALRLNQAAEGLDVLRRQKHLLGEALRRLSKWSRPLQGNARFYRTSPNYITISGFPPHIDLQAVGFHANMPIRPVILPNRGE